MFMCIRIVCQSEVNWEVVLVFELRYSEYSVKCTFYHHISVIVHFILFYFITDVHAIWIDTFQKKIQTGDGKKEHNSLPTSNQQ